MVFVKLVPYFINSCHFPSQSLWIAECYSIQLLVGFLPELYGSENSTQNNNVVLYYFQQLPLLFSDDDKCVVK